MKKVRVISTAAMLALLSVGSMTFVSCTPEDEICPVGMEGKKCDDEVRVNYYNTYRGNATDNDGGTYTNWALKFSNGGTEATKLKLEVLDNVNANQFLFTATLKTNTTFEITPTTVSGLNYTGQGSISGTNASFTLTEVDPSGGTQTYIYSFNNFIKE